MDGRYYYFTTIPVVSDGQVVGAVVVGTSLNTLLPFSKSTSLADVIIYGENGQAIVSSLGSQGMHTVFLRTISIPLERYREIILQDNLVRGENFTADGRWYQPGDAVRSKLARTASASSRLSCPWISWSNPVPSAATTTSFCIPAMIAVILIGYFVARLIINPLSKLVRTSRAIADGDLTKRTEIESRDEIGVLANTFDDMTENLQQRTLELEKTNRILEQMDRTKMRFIQVSAHELRTPMTLVQGYAQMIQMKSKENEELSRYTNGILDGSNRMVEVIDSMLDVSRIDTNQLEIMPEKMQVDVGHRESSKGISVCLQGTQHHFRQRDQRPARDLR